MNFIDKVPSDSEQANGRERVKKIRNKKTKKIKR